jgi:hypothetical protein
MARAISVSEAPPASSSMITVAAIGSDSIDPIGA